MENQQACEKYLVGKLEEWFRTHYTPAKREGIVKRFSTINEHQLVSIYDYLVENCKRLPELPEMLEAYDVIRHRAKLGGATHATPSSGARYPWEERSDKAKKDAKSYANWALDNEPAWQDARREGLDSQARRFIESWAYNQSIVMQGGQNLGVDYGMLGNPRDSDEYEARLAEMRTAWRAAMDRNAIMVPCPDWFFEWARRDRDIYRSAIAQQPKTTSAA